jgi:hypothetical protein
MCRLGCCPIWRQRPHTSRAGRALHCRLQGPLSKWRWEVMATAQTVSRNDAARLTSAAAMKAYGPLTLEWPFECISSQRLCACARAGLQAAYGDLHPRWEAQELKQACVAARTSHRFIFVYLHSPEHQVGGRETDRYPAIVHTSLLLRQECVGFYPHCCAHSCTRV